jgi:hypothetical protein
MKSLEVWTAGQLRVCPQRTLCWGIRVSLPGPHELPSAESWDNVSKPAFRRICGLLSITPLESTPNSTMTTLSLSPLHAGCWRLHSGFSPSQLCGLGKPVFQFLFLKKEDKIL